MLDRLPKKVLVIESNPDIRQLIEITVRKVGSEPSAVSSIAEARNVLLSQAFDLLVVDVAVGEIECETLVQGIHRTKPRFPVVLFVENRGMIPSKLRNDHCFGLPKFDWKLLQDVIQQLLEDSEAV